MKAPLYVRALTPAEQAGIEAGLRSSNAFTLRRSQILFASSREQRRREYPEQGYPGLRYVTMDRADLAFFEA